MKTYKVVKWPDADIGDSKCTCDKMDEDYEDSCPYAADVGNNPNVMCGCCPYCRQQCAEDI